MRGIFVSLFLFLFLNMSAQNKIPTKENNRAKAWVDSVYKSLSNEERIAQLLVVRLSTYNFVNKKTVFFDTSVERLVKKYNIGSICLFQGNPVQQATLINHLQSITKTPILTCIDAEWGLGMRMFDSVQSLPHQMMLGAMQDSSIVYNYGNLVGEQCKRMGIQVNYAPVVDINNNPDNPVINDRSFGEDKYKVARFGIQYMKGLQDAGVMACAKHFPGHGDVTVDSHLDLPVIKKSIQQLDSLELYPFQQLFGAGVGSVMIAHLYIPAIDNTPNTATSISKNNVTGLLRHTLHFQGLTFTDALEMQGVKKYFPDGEASVQALIAGNDMLCLPDNIPQAIEKIKAAIKKKKLSWKDIELHCKKVLMAKYRYGLYNWKPIDTVNLTADLNKGISSMKRKVAENAITLLNNRDNYFFPMEKSNEDCIAYVGIGIKTDNAFARRMKKDYNADLYYFNYNQSDSDAAVLLESIKQYKAVVIGIHNFSRTPANHFGISKTAINFIDSLQQQTKSISFVFGNPYAIKNFCDAKNLVACYEDDSIIQNTAADLLQDKILYKGKLPVTICDQYQSGSGISPVPYSLPVANPDAVGLDVVKLNSIDSIVNDAISKKAMPGCQVLVAKDGKIIFQKAYGYYNYDQKEKVTNESVYDLASVTKIAATTLAVMKLYDEGKIRLDKKLGDYLSWVKGSNKDDLIIKDILLHQAGLVPFIRFYKETLDSGGLPNPKYYSATPNDSFSIRITGNLFLRNEWTDTMYKRILESPVINSGHYNYSDNDFIFLGKVVEAVSGMSLDDYAEKYFYAPLGIFSTHFKPYQYFSLDKIVPTEQDYTFRHQLLRGDVHDPGAAMFGGVAGHAGLFSNTSDLAVLMQMLLNGGTMNGQQFIQKQTIDLFTAYQSDVSRRGFGFDKPDKNNDTRKEPYPCISASPLTFGHTGFTGTCIWSDPSKQLTYIFLSNRITPTTSNETLLNLDVRGKIMEAIYQALMK